MRFSKKFSFRCDKTAFLFVYIYGAVGKGERRIKRELFEDYVEAYGRILFRLCFSLCRNSADASDLYQDTWMRAFASYDSHDPEKEIVKWLYSICVNRFRDICREKKRRPEEVKFDSNEHKDAFMASLPSGGGFGKSDFELLYQAMDKLPENQREVLSLKYFSDMSCEEIGIVLGISVSAVTTRLSRALNGMRTYMNGREEQTDEEIHE